MVKNVDRFIDFVRDEVDNSLLRDTLEMVIIGSSKEAEKNSF